MMSAPHPRSRSIASAPALSNCRCKSPAQDARGYATAQDESFYRQQRELLGEVVAQSDTVISTAAVPGKKPPLLVTTDAVKKMTPGSVIVDLAAEQGGNCESTQPGKDIWVDGVKVIGRINLASAVPYHASLMYSRNLTAFLGLLVKKSGAHHRPHRRHHPQHAADRAGQSSIPRAQKRFLYRPWRPNQSAR